jgi:hypothetical protein
MLLNLPLLADLQTLHEKRLEIVKRNLEVANRRQIRYDYQPGQRIAVKQDHSKLGIRTDGPCRIMQVHTNGTVGDLELQSESSFDR